MQWEISSFPACSHHVFLSHCREDRQRLVWPLYHALDQQRIVAWLDRHHYPGGRRSFDALRSSVLKCQHVVFLVTRSMLQQPRGWGVVELSCAEILQENLQTPGGWLQNVALPLIFVDRNDTSLAHSAWSVLSDRAIFAPAGLRGYRARAGWAATTIAQFVQRENQLALEMSEQLKQDSDFRRRMRQRSGLASRITKQDPKPAGISDGH